MMVCYESFTSAKVSISCLLGGGTCCKEVGVAASTIFLFCFFVLLMTAGWFLVAMMTLLPLPYSLA